MRVSWSPAEGDDDDVTTRSTLRTRELENINGQRTSVYTFNTQHRERGRERDASVLSSDQPVGVNVPDVRQVDVAPRGNVEASLFMENLLGVLSYLDLHGLAGTLHQRGNLDSVTEHRVVGDLGSDHPANNLGNNSIKDCHPQPHPPGHCEVPSGA